MCRLLGIRANRPVDIKFSLSNFQRFAEKNPDGYGIGWYENDEPKVFREPICALDSEHFLRIGREVRSHIFICHVRRGTCGERREENCHPFQYGRWLFAHNGSVYRKDVLHGRLRAEHQNAISGGTDSEVYFHWILQNIEDCGNDVVRGICAAVEFIYHRYCFTGLNFLLSDGKNLYAFRYASQDSSYYSLYYLQRDPKDWPSGAINLESKELGTLIQSKKLKDERAVLVCSECLTKEEDWRSIDLGNLLIISESLEIKQKRLI
jgi:predicted glutamine amidotransferase